MRDRAAAHRLIGGSPLTVLVRLAAVSLLVGATMSWLGIDAADLIYDLQRTVVHLYGTGFAALHDVGRTALAGAAVVVPVWLVLRALSYRGGRSRPVAEDDHRVDVMPPRWSNPERRP